MKRLVSFILIVSMLLAPVKVFAQDGLKEKADSLASLLTAYGAASVQYALIDNGKIVITGGADARLISSSDSAYIEKMYGIGSVSKMYVAAAVMMLADKGLLEIDKPVVDYIPEFKMSDERYKDITPRMLLNHSSGLYGTHSNNAFLFDDTDSYAHDNLLSELSVQSLKADPGEFSVYCNDGFTLLEILVERVSGVSFTQFLHTYISEPLGLSKTKTPQDVFNRESLADTYSPYYDSKLPADTVGMIGTGGIYTTAAELALFADALMGNREDVLSGKAAQAMYNEEFKNGIWVEESANLVAYGLGWDSVCLTPFDAYGISAATKGGDTLIYHASLVALPEYGMAMAVVSSGGQSLYNGLMAADILQEALLEKGIINEITQDKTYEAPVKQEIPEELLRYAGIYANFGSAANIYLQNGEMIILMELMGNEIAQAYTYAGEGKFKNADGSITMSFDEQSGRVYLKVEYYVTIPGLGQVSQIYYDSQLLEPNPLSAEIYAEWARRADDIYFIVNEKATSQIYILSNIATMLLIELENGYAGGSRIVDADTAVNAVQIPISYGRDVADFNFYNENGVDYLEMNGFVMISGDNINPIYGGAASVCTIQESGYARWHKIGEDSAGKIMTVQIPEGASFTVYNASFVCVNYSLVSGLNEVTLPTGGYIVFAGDPGDVFNITLR